MPDKTNHGRRVSRRSFVGTVTSAGAIGLLGSASTAQQDNRSFPIVSTRGHLVGDLFETNLAQGVGRYEYDLEGDLPGYSTAEQPDELVVYVHGAFQTAESAANRFPKQIDEMEKAGIDAEFALFSWDAHWFRGNWWRQSSAAINNGPKLAAFLRDYKQRNPDTTVRVIGMSLGTRVLPRAAEALAEFDWSGTIESGTMMGASLPAENVSLEGRSGPAIQETFGLMQNFLKTDDSVLNWMYKIAEFEDPLGTEGVVGTSPSNYRDIDVTDEVEHHNLYWHYDEGCMDVIGESWE